MTELHNGEPPDEKWALSCHSIVHAGKRTTDFPVTA
jgi:hypothetical protein